MSATQYLERPDGRIAYDVTGDQSGPLVICAPGMGDLRSTFRPLADALAGAGARAVTTDLRGHGESTSNWPDYSHRAVADDLLALVHALDKGTPAILVGNSYAGGAAVLAATRDPAAVAGIVLVDAFVREQPEPGAVMKLVIAALKTPRLGRRLWTMVAWPSFFKRKPADYSDRRAELKASLTEPGRYDAVRAMLAPPEGNTPARKALPAVRQPALVVMGERDADFADPAAEATFTADALGGPARVVMVPGVGHYPQTEAAEVVAPAVIEFVREAAGAPRGPDA
jgi:pimeloyl-ACP methyl ester carboxylesterase